MEEQHDHKCSLSTLTSQLAFEQKRVERVQRLRDDLRDDVQVKEHKGLVQIRDIPEKEEGDNMEINWKNLIGYYLWDSKEKNI